MGLVDALWPPDQFEAGVQQFINALVVPPSGGIEHCGGIAAALPPKGGTTSAKIRPEGGTASILDAARRRLLRGRHPPAVPAILSAVEAGIRDGRGAGLARERTAFGELLFGDFCRREVVAIFQSIVPPQRNGDITHLCEAPSGPFRQMSDVPVSPPWVSGLTIGAALRQTASRYADREAMVFPQAALRLTWAEFDRRVDRAARGLLAIGLRRGDHFGVWSTNWPEWVFLQFAAARIGVDLRRRSTRRIASRGTSVCPG